MEHGEAVDFEVFPAEKSCVTFDDLWASPTFPNYPAGKAKFVRFYFSSESVEAITPETAHIEMTVSDSADYLLGSNKACRLESGKLFFLKWV
jgi:hypothetical protein